MEQEERIRDEIEHCFKYEPEEKQICFGAGGRRLRRVCIYCPNYRDKREEKNHEKNH